MVVVAIAYGATWLLGVRAVKPAHRQDLLHFYKKQEAFYGENRADLEKNVFWKDILENYRGFPTWEEYQDWHAREQDDRYYAAIPFIILA